MISKNLVRFVSSDNLQLIILLYVFFAVALPCRAQWTGTNIGGGTGSSTWTSSTGVLTIVGGGSGAAMDTDQCRFTSVPVSGDFKLVARVASFTGSTNSQVGLAVRQNFTATCSAGGIYFMPGIGAAPYPNRVVYQQRNMQPGALYKTSHPSSNGVKTAINPPLWLQLVRVGDNFAVYRSTDGADWSPVANSSGSAFAISGTVNVGFVVASGGAGTVTAVIDNIYLKKTSTSMLPWRTSWLGNTFASDSTSTVSADVAAMWVDADGSCYTNCLWEEIGENVKIYKNGQIHRAKSIVGSGYEGSIVGDGAGKIFTVKGNSVYATWFPEGAAGDNGAFFCRVQTIDSVGLASGAPRVSGLAHSGSGTSARLYISRVADDPASDQMGKVLVVEPNKDLGAITSQDGRMWNNIVNNTIDTMGLTNPAPQAVYQSQYEGVGTGSSMIYTIPGLTSGVSYTVRLHFAEFKATAAGQRVMNLWVTGAGSPHHEPNYDVYANAGAQFKATIHQFNNVVAPANGTVTVQLTAVTNNPILNGIEVLNPDNSAFKLINCGGGAADGWENNTHQASSFDFTRPGPIAVDKRGNLWIIQEGRPYPTSAQFAYNNGWAAIKCHSGTGTNGYLGKQITDVVNPTAIWYDDRNGADRLLVAENGPNQNIRVYTNLTGTPTCTGTFGQQGGVFSGTAPGSVFDAAAGNDARFLGFAGLGMDSGGNLYVACNAGSHITDLKKFPASGTTWSTTAAWKLRSLEEISCGDFDPTVNASDVWSVGRRYAMNYSSTTPGGEWTLKSYQWNPFGNPGLGVQPPRGESTVYRKINGTPFLYTAQQGFAGAVRIYRFVGEELRPCGRIGKVVGGAFSIWIDTDGDGIEDEGAISQPQLFNADIQAFDVDAAGNVYLGMGGNYVHKMTFSTINGVGVPVYTTAGWAHQTVTGAPPTFWIQRLRYIGGASDTMYLMSFESPNAADKTYGGTVVRYDNWHSSRSLVFSATLPKPATNPNFLYYPGLYDINGFQYKAFDVAGNYIFAGELWGPVHVLNAATGASAAKLLPGPEISGRLVWQDHCMGLRAHYNATDKEYYVLTENSAWRGRNNFFRWKPVEKTPTAYYVLNQTSGTSVPDTSGNANNGTLTGTVVSGTTWSAGRFSNALNFNGTNNCVSVPNNLIKNHTTVTFACWFRTGFANGGILGQQDTAFPSGPTENVPLVYIGADGKLRGGFWHGVVENIVSTGTVTDGQWHHVALVGNVNTQSLYLDGQLVGTQAGAISHSRMQYNQLGGVLIGSWPGGVPSSIAYFKGDLDDVRFYNQALSAADVANLAAH